MKEETLNEIKTKVKHVHEVQFPSMHWGAIVKEMEEQYVPVWPKSTIRALYAPQTNDAAGGLLVGPFVTAALSLSA